VSNIWEQVDKAIEAQSRIILLLDSGIEIEGNAISKDTFGNIQLKTEDKGTITIFWNKVAGVSILDNLTWVEIQAKRKGLI
jgi:hypothetical protein